MLSCVELFQFDRSFVLCLTAADLAKLLSLCTALQDLRRTMLQHRALPDDFPLEVLHHAGDPPGRLRLVGSTGSVGLCEYHLLPCLANGHACYRSAGLPTMVLKRGRGHCRMYCYIWWNSGWRVTVNDKPPPSKGELLGRLAHAPWVCPCRVDLKGETAEGTGWSHSSLDESATVEAVDDLARARQAKA
eukprot:TRINITY_DN100752_c0_g1_i1.p1 TRINITY_DN100752_c0_g1~~TRINITY_DN100752_c0_g1_i1.p1  ORF type:complete len:189 (-),score=24.31 TRINITY_DN100752_c0_g1_i1:289-855(-)